VTDSQILKIIGTNVRAARLQANLTQECLAQLIGVQWQTISYLENGKYPYPVMRLARLSHALKVSPNFLLDGLPSPNEARMERIKKILARKRKPKSD
jgi:transcriptional regulator with XRE-family HTH domain